MCSIRILSVAAFALLLTASPAPAQFLRDPQVPIQGTSLQQLLDGLGQAIDVNTEQYFIPVFTAVFLTRPPLNFVASPAAGTGTLSLYNAVPVGPEVFQIVAAPQPPGWHAWVRFDTPGGVTVQLLDEVGGVQGTVVHPGANPFAMNFAVTGTLGAFYMEDARNAGGAAHLLAFRGTGAHLFDTWLAAETDGDEDFSDALFLLGGTWTVPAARASWGAVKQRFR